MKWTPIIAIVCISGLEVVAILSGVNGATFGIVITALAGLGGYELRAYYNKRKGDR